MHPDDGRVISNFIVQSLSKKNLTIYGNGKQTRSFCYVDDLVTGMIRMMEKDNFIGPVNLGNPIEMTILEIAEKIIELTNSSSKIIFKELPLDDPLKRRPDITLAKDRLEWLPKISFEDGIKRTIKYFIKNRNEEQE